MDRVTGATIPSKQSHTRKIASTLFGVLVSSPAEDVMGRTEPALLQQRKFFRTKEFPVFMLANQLPLLQLGRKPAQVRGEIADYCRSDGRKHNRRLAESRPFIAFSDPNDILSYAIPPKFAEEYMDSRICPRITNVVLNVARPISVLGLGEIANPPEAHTGYDHDDRVIAMMAHGIGGEDQATIVAERCSWMETTKFE